MNIKSSCATLCSALLLQSCIASVVVGSAAIATKSITDPRSLGTQVDDATLEARVENALHKDLRLKKHCRVIVTAYRGRILLTGQSINNDVTRYALGIVKETNGVKEVYNAILHTKPISLRTIFFDTWITAKIYLNLLISSTVKASNIKATTENSAVFLLGLVTPLEAKAAANIVSKISGVKHVTTAFSYIR
ncbi:division/outer membrane stress-associated lipid-binding lipoprotein [Candidatus Gillettellia adelgis]